MNDQVISVVALLAQHTLDEKLTWRRTDAPDTFLLARPPGTVVIGPSGTGTAGERPLLYIRFVDDDATTIFEFVETQERDPIDKPLVELWTAVRDRTSEIGLTMNQWLSDLMSLDDEF